MSRRIRLDRERWHDLCRRFGCERCDDHYAVLDAAYAEDHRHYHTARHVYECLQLFDRTCLSADRPDEVEMALWLHDIVYVPWRRDNEARSADLATEWLAACRADQAVVERIRRLILSTRHVEPPVGQDEALLVDVDLGILSAPPDRYGEYEKQVRREYRRIPGPIFRARRRKILSAFLDRETVYHTPWFLEHREERARQNIERSLARMAGRRDGA